MQVDLLYAIEHNPPNDESARVGNESASTKVILRVESGKGQTNLILAAGFYAGRACVVVRSWEMHIIYNYSIIRLYCIEDIIVVIEAGCLSSQPKGTYIHLIWSSSRRVQFYL